MAASLIADCWEVRDPAQMAEYRADMAPNAEKYGGRFPAGGGPFRVVEGDWQPVFPVAIEFAGMAQREGRYRLGDFREMKALRHAGARTNILFLDGLAPAPLGAKE